MQAVRERAPLFAALSGLYLIVAATLAISLLRNHGHFIYSADDTYIHLAMAKHLAQAGVWGVTRQGFSSSSSSLLWTLLLAFSNLLIGVHSATPFLWNLVLAGAWLWVFDRELRRAGWSGKSLGLALMAAVLLMPLPPLVFYGMEHLLHALLSLVFAAGAARFLSQDRPTTTARLLLILLAPLLVLARYEGMFLLLVVGGLFWLKGRRRDALLLAGAGLLPVVVYGLISVAKGSYFVPNPVLLKGKSPDWSSVRGLLDYLFLSVSREMAFDPSMFVLLVLLLVFLYAELEKEPSVWKVPTLMAIITVATGILHLQASLARMRYEAYLVGMAFSTLGLLLAPALPRLQLWPLRSRRIPQYLILLLLLFLGGLPLVRRALGPIYFTPGYTTNIYEQQYQMARFLNQYYSGAVVGMNDIGAINYYADLQSVDLWGLASIAVTRDLVNRNYHTRQIQEIAEQSRMKIAVVYDAWFNRLGIGGVPASWLKVGQWKITHNLTCGSDVVSWYAVDPAEQEALRTHLQAFAGELPKTVIQSGLYTQ